MKQGDKVKFVNETEAEKGIEMVVVWVDAPRAMVESKIGFTVNPTMIVNVNEIEVVNE